MDGSPGLWERGGGVLHSEGISGVEGEGEGGSFQEIQLLVCTK